MNKRGYEPAINKSQSLKNLINGLDTLDEMGTEFLDIIEKEASGITVTRTELKRDYGFPEASLRLLEKYKLLTPISNSKQRKTYELAKALRIRVYLSGILVAKNVRIVRKHNNIVTVYRDHFNKITSNRKYI